MACRLAHAVVDVVGVQVPLVQLTIRGLKMHGERRSRDVAEAVQITIEGKAEQGKWAEDLERRQLLS